MGEIRLIHFADLHLGVEAGGRPNPETGLNQRIHDVCDRFDELCSVVEEEEVDAVLFAGDAFKNQHPSPTLQNLFARRVRRLARSGAAVFLLVGNHDLPRSAGLAHPFSIYDALETENVVVGDRAAVYALPLRDGRTLNVAAIPHFSRHDVLARLPRDFAGDVDNVIRRAFLDTVGRLREDAPRPSVFVGHLHVPQADAGLTRDVFGVSDVEVSLNDLLTGSPFAYHALGHLHKRQVLNDEPFAAYSGSLERVDFGEGDRVDVSSTSVKRLEAEPKGFYRFDLDADGTLSEKPVFRPVGARTFVTLRVGSLSVTDPLGDLERRLRAARHAGVPLRDAFVKINGRTATADRQRITRSAVRTLVPEAYDTRIALESHDDQASERDPRFAEPMSEYDALLKFVETRDDWAGERDELLRLGRALIDEVLA
jgi:exonuclease SbcD